MTPMEKIMAARPEVRKAALELLDEVSGPMQAREIERALCKYGFTRSKARPIVNALKNLPIIVIGAGKF